MDFKSLSLRTYVRGIYHLLFRPSNSFAQEERKIKRLYYSPQSPLKGISNTTIILMIDGRSVHGGLTDRIRAITTIYQYCKLRKITYKLSHSYPFNLTKILEPTIDSNWEITPDKISYNTEEVAIGVINDYQLPLRFHKPYLDFLTRKHRGKQIHLYTNTYFNDHLFSVTFKEMFTPSSKLQNAIENNIQDIGHNYIAITLRFQQLLGDFYEKGYKILSPNEQAKLIDKCTDKIKSIHNETHPNYTILVTSDSVKFLNHISSLFSFVRIIRGKVVHMDHTIDAPLDVYMKSYIDLFLISKAKKVYLLRTDDMYKSGFPKRASMLGDIPFEEIIF